MAAPSSSRAGGATSDALGDRLRALGAERPGAALHRRSVRPSPGGRSTRRCAGSTAFDWVVFASGNGVERTLERMAALGVPRRALAVPPARRGRARDGAAARRATSAPPTSCRPRRRGRRSRPSSAPLRARPQGAAPARRGRVARSCRTGSSRRARCSRRRTPTGPSRPRRGRCARSPRWIVRGEVDAVAFASPSAVKAVTGALGAEREALQRSARRHRPHHRGRAARRRLRARRDAGGVHGAGARRGDRGAARAAVADAPPLRGVPGCRGLPCTREGQARRNVLNSSIRARAIPSCRRGDDPSQQGPRPRAARRRARGRVPRGALDARPAARAGGGSGPGVAPRRGRLRGGHRVRARAQRAPSESGCSRSPRSGSRPGSSGRRSRARGASRSTRSSTPSPRCGSRSAATRRS